MYTKIAMYVTVGVHYFSMKVMKSMKAMKSGVAPKKKPAAAEEKALGSSRETQVYIYIYIYVCVYI